MPILSTPKYGPTIVIVGDPLSGFEFIGPFDTAAEATIWATDHCSNTWIVTPLLTKEGYASL